MIGGIAYLSNKGEYISFSYGSKVVRFKGPYSLKEIKKVLSWDNGYIVVEAIYNNIDDIVEDYIDLIPILQNLYIDVDEFFKPIEKVEVNNV